MHSVMISLQKKVINSNSIMLTSYTCPDHWAGVSMHAGDDVLAITNTATVAAIIKNLFILSVQN